MSEAGSGIEGMRDDSAFARHVAARLTEPFQLIDVGAAGGVANGWRVFGDRLAALAYEADAAEVERLNAAETNPAVRYVAGMVGLAPGDPLRARLEQRHRHHNWAGGRLSFERIRTIRNAHAAGHAPLSIDGHFNVSVAGVKPLPPEDGYDTDYAAVFGAAPSGEAPPTPGGRDGPPWIVLAEHVREHGFEAADFLKIDVDGPDFEILRSCPELLARPTLLGAALEVNFIGSHDANDNTFHNMDRLMREKGFDLFGLSIRSYSSAALPSLFMDRHVGPTFQGRPFQGDAIYLRDLASPFWRETAAEVSDDKLAKLAALFSLFNLSDQAAELLIVHRDRLDPLLDAAATLELLTTQIQEPWPEGVSYADWTAMFEAEHSFFFDVYGKRNTWLNNLLKTSREAPVTIADLQRRLDDMTAERDAEALARQEAEGRLTRPPPQGPTGPMEALKRFFGGRRGESPG